MLQRKALASVDADSAFLRRFLDKRLPKAQVALFAGSRSRGQGSEGSDYDLVLLFESLVESGAWRETVAFEQREIEIFAHDLGTLKYFFREIDGPSGIPTLPTMVAEGVTVCTRSPALEAEARSIAVRTLAEGPPTLEQSAVDMRRYAITDLATALRSSRNPDVQTAVGAKLYELLADFALRAAGQWSASGKGIPEALGKLDAKLATMFAGCFNACFRHESGDELQALVDHVLAPYGGRLRTGFRAVAPREWRFPR